MQQVLADALVGQDFVGVDPELLVNCLACGCCEMKWEGNLTIVRTRDDDPVGRGVAQRESNPRRRVLHRAPVAPRASGK